MTAGPHPIMCRCGWLVGFYDGPVQANTPIISRHFIRADGTRAMPHTISSEQCPECGHVLNIIRELARYIGR